MSKQEKKVKLSEPRDRVIAVTKISDNTGQELTKVTKDKVELCLMKYLDNIERRNSWSTPLAILLTVALTFVTTNFKTFFLGAEIWEAVFLIVGILSAFWLIRSLIKRPREKEIDDIINVLKSGDNTSLT